MVINPRIGRCLNQTIIGYRTVEQTPWDRLPIGLRIYSKGLSVLSDHHLTISTHRDGCKQARAAQEPRTDRQSQDCAGIYDTTLSAWFCHLQNSLNLQNHSRKIHSHTRNYSFNLYPNVFTRKFLTFFIITFFLLQLYDSIFLICFFKLQLDLIFNTI